MTDERQDKPHWFPAFLAVAGGLAWTQPRVAGSDLWWHLASGRDILERGSVPSVDSFSFTFAGREWMNHEWLWDVMMWSLYQANREFVAWGNLALIGTILALAYVEALRRSGSAVASVVAVWAGAACAQFFFDIRPHITTLLLVHIFLVTRDWKHAPLMWPPMVAVWANAHGGFVFGYGTIGLYALVRTITSNLGKKRFVIDKKLWTGVALAGAAMLLNPWGYRIFEYPLAYLNSDSPYRSILEWHAPPFELDVRSYAGRFWMLFALCLPGALISFKRMPYPVLLAGVAFSMAYTSRRFIPLFALIALPLLAVGIAALLRNVRRSWPSLERSELPAVAGVIAGLLALGASWSNVKLAPDLLERWTLEDRYPIAALTYLVAIDPGPRLINYYNWGGYVMLLAPGFKTTIDGRANTLFDDNTYLAYGGFMRGDKRGIPGLKRLDADAALLPAGKRSMLGLLTGEEMGWQIVYSDRIAAVLLPPDSPVLNRRIKPVEVLENTAQFLQMRGTNAISRGQHDEGRRLLKRSLQKDPLLALNYTHIARSYLETGDMAASARWVDRGVEALPRRADRLRDIQASMLDKAGYTKEALDAARQGVAYGPFSNAKSGKDRIERLTKKLGKK